MPKIETSSTSADFFLLNGEEYPRCLYEPVYNDIQTTAPATIDESLIRVGLRQKYTEELIQMPVLVSQWTDSSDTPYASLTALLTALDTLVSFVCGSTPSYEEIGITRWYGTLPNTDLSYPNGVGATNLDAPLVCLGFSNDAFNVWFDDDGEISLSSPVGGAAPGDNPTFGANIGEYITNRSPQEIVVYQMRNHFNRADQTDKVINPNGTGMARNSCQIWNNVSGFYTNAYNGKVYIDFTGQTTQIMEASALSECDNTEEWARSGFCEGTGSVHNTQDVATGATNFSARSANFLNVEASGTGVLSVVGTPHNTRPIAFYANCDPTLEQSQGFGDGQLKNTTAWGGPVPYTNDILRIGAQFESGGVPQDRFVGEFQLIRIHNGLLTTATAQDLFDKDEAAGYCGFPP